MTTEQILRTAGRYARVVPGDEAIVKHFVRAVTDGRGTYRYVFHLCGTTYVVLKEREGDHPYRSAKIWETGCIDRTYDSWKTKIPVERSNDEIVEAYARAMEMIFEVVAYVMEELDDIE